MQHRRTIRLGILLSLALAPLCYGKGAFLANLTWPEAESRFASAPIVIVPFGAGAKEHGPHLAMGTDAALMAHLCQIAVEREDVLVAPPILHGWFPAFRQWPGTEIADPELFRSYVQAVGQSLLNAGAQRLVFLNTGVSRATGLPIAIAARELRALTGVPTLVVSWDDLETDEASALAGQSVGGHADEVETALMLVLNPKGVQMDKALQDSGKQPAKSYPGYRPGVFARNPKDPGYSSTGIKGNPTLATEKTGRAVLRIMEANWLTALRGFAREAVLEK